MIAVLIALLAVGGLVLAYLQESVAWAWAALALAVAGGLLLMYLLVGDAFFDEDELADDDDPTEETARPDRGAAAAAVDVTGAVPSEVGAPATGPQFLERSWRARDRTDTAGGPPTDEPVVRAEPAQPPTPAVVPPPVPPPVPPAERRRWRRGRDDG